MADTLSDVTKKLSDNNQQNRLGHTETRNQLVQLNMKFDNFFTTLKEQFGDKLEDKRESRNEKAAGRTSAKTKGKDGNRVNILGGLGGVLGGLTAGLVALGASLTGLDDVLRGAFIVKTLAQVGAGLARIAKGIADAGASVIRGLRATITGINEFGKNLLRVIVIPDETKALFANFIDDIRLRWMLFTDDVKKVFSQKLTEFKPQIVTNIIDTITDFLKAARVGILTTIPEDIGKVTTRVSEILRPITNFFSAIPEKLGSIGKFLPTINFDALKNLFQGADGTGGILGFFTKVFNFLEPILKPIKFVIQTALRPFVQILLSAIDFIVGFYQGFTGTDKEGVLSKLGAGVEGGIKGVIKGFTQAIDLIFIDFPAWIMDKLGFSNVAANLKKYKLTDLVDPIFDAIKFFFTNIFTNPSAVFAPVANMLKNIPLDFMKTILQAVLPDPNAFKFTIPNNKVTDMLGLGGLGANLNPFPADLYRFAGINPETGQQISRSSTNMSADDLTDNESAFEGSGGTVGIVGSGNDNSQVINQNSYSQNSGGSSQDNGFIPDYIRGI